jgi:membrane protease YdiL (CAAX protease family)
MTVDVAVALLLALSVYPLLEEAIFRWGMLGWLDQREGAWQPQVNNVVTSLSFSAAHLAAWGIWHAVAVFVPSFILGMVWQRWHSFVCCVALHSVFNLVGIAIDRTA